MCIYIYVICSTIIKKKTYYNLLFSWWNGGRIHPMRNAKQKWACLRRCVHQRRSIRHLVPQSWLPQWGTELHPGFLSTRPESHIDVKLRSRWSGSNSSCSKSAKTPDVSPESNRDRGHGGHGQEIRGNLLGSSFKIATYRVPGLVIPNSLRTGKWPSRNSWSMLTHDLPWWSPIVLLNSVDQRRNLRPPPGSLPCCWTCAGCCCLGAQPRVRPERPEISPRIRQNRGKPK